MRRNRGSRRSGRENPPFLACALHWRLRGVNVAKERDEWKRAPDKYTSPMLSRNYLPRAGAGHFIRGQWPPAVVPQKVWDVVDLYLLVGWSPEAAGHLPEAGPLADQDAWTMDAIHKLRVADSQIQAARLKEWQATEGSS